MKRIFLSVLTITLLLSGCAAAAAEGVEVRQAWIRPAAQGGNGAVYFVIRSSDADTLTGASSAVAEAVEMHESRMSGDVMEMHQLQSVALEAGERVTFEPGGLHIMLIGLKQELKTGEEIELTLHFETHADLTVHVPVSDMPVSEENHPATSE